MKNKELLTIWNSLKERILSKFSFLKQRHQNHLNQIFDFVSSDDGIEMRNYTFEEVITETKRTRTVKKRELKTKKKVRGLW